MKPSEVPDELVRMAAVGQMGVEVRVALARVIPEIRRQEREPLLALAEEWEQYHRDSDYEDRWDRGHACAHKDLAKQLRAVLAALDRPGQASPPAPTPDPPATPTGEQR